MPFMKNFPTTIQLLDRHEWHTPIDVNPQESGRYLTRNAQGHYWFKFFDARSKIWIKSWAELRTEATDTGARITTSHPSSHVLAWANITLPRQPHPSVSKHKPPRVNTNATALMPHAKQGEAANQAFGAVLKTGTDGWDAF